MLELSGGRRSQAYTLLLFGYGVLSILLWARSLLGKPSVLPDSRTDFSPGAGYHLAFGIMAILVALLRLFKGARAWPASVVGSLYLAIEPPLGTALFLLWLLWVRPREPRPPFYKIGRVTRYTLGTLAVGFAVLIATLMLDLSWVSKLCGALSLVSIATGIARCVNPRWGYCAAFVLSILLIPFFPFGTTVSLYWLMQVRREEDEASELDLDSVATEFE